jgi:F-type H+-transporting ATPase subunit gamma
MKNAREIKRRIKSVHNTQQITKAMEMVAASKMRKAQEFALRSRPYADRLVDVLNDVAAVIGTKVQDHPLLQSRAGGSQAVALITADRGLCGGLNTNIFRFVARDIIGRGEEKRSIEEGVEQQLDGALANAGGRARQTFMLTVGKKGRDFARRSGHSIIAEFLQFSDYPTFADIIPITKVLIEDYLNGKFNQLQLVYTKFLSTLNQRPVALQLLPIDPKRFGWLGALKGRTRTFADYTYEPSPEGVFSELLPHMIEMEVYQALLEAKASEHSARMVAMRNASDNAGELIDDLVLSYNQARQAGITQEIAEISAGAM